MCLSFLKWNIDNNQSITNSFVMASFIVDELLCFLSTQFDSLVRTYLNSAILETYLIDDLQSAKQILIAECKKIKVTDAIKDFVKDRRITKSRSKEDVKQLVLTDIIDIWQHVDVEKGGKLLSQFVAADPNRLPSVSADKHNLKLLSRLFLKVSKSQKHFLS